jgi:hypothetical protein
MYAMPMPHQNERSLILAEAAENFQCGESIIPSIILNVNVFEIGDIWSRWATYGAQLMSHVIAEPWVSKL